MKEEIHEFGKTLTKTHRIKEIKDQYQAENQTVLDLTQTEYISKPAAKELYNSQLSMKLSEPVQKMLQVIATEQQR